MSSGGTPASAWASPGPKGQALGIAGDPAAAVSLRDGLTVQIRPVRADDAAAVRCLFQGLSETSTWLRFFSSCPRLDRVVDWATDMDNNRRRGLVAIAADTGQLIAHAGLERDPGQPDRAEFALVIADRYQGRGLGRLLLGRLVEAARQAGIRWLTGEVLANNHRMLNLLRHAEYPVSLRLSSGVVLAELATSPCPGTAWDVRSRLVTAGIGYQQDRSVVAAPAGDRAGAAQRDQGAAGRGHVRTDQDLLAIASRRQLTPSVPERSPVRRRPAARRTGAHRAMPGIDQPVSFRGANPDPS